MQATQTTQRFGSVQIRRIVVAAGLLACLAIGAAALDVADQFPAFGDAESRAVTAPQITSDEQYALEAGLTGAQVDGWQAAVTQMTYDEAWAFEAALVATAAAYQHNQMMQLTPDEAWAIEQSQLDDRSSERPSNRPADRPTGQGAGH